MPSCKPILVLVAMCILGAGSRSQAQPKSRDWGFNKPFSYILWDGHRFASTPEEHERDARYFKDLGFTHTLFDARHGSLDAKHVESRSQLLAMLAKYDLVSGLKFGWRSEAFDRSWDDMTAQGMTLRATRDAKDTSPVPALNPLHPSVIDTYTQGILASYQSHRTLDPAGRIKFFLIGSEYSFALPEMSKCPPAALELILKTAREDGALGPDETDWTKVKAWWTGVSSKGGDWRIRKTLADEIHKITPDARFMIDPIWCIKLVDGTLGGHWSYIGKGMVLGMPDDAIRTMAQSWPYPATHSVQLIQGAHHDTILEGNLMCLCVGLPSLYHWGINTFEPGRSDTPYYRYKGPKSPEVETELRAGIATDRLDKEPALRSTGRFIRERGAMLRDWRPLEPRVAYLAGVYGPADPQLVMLVGQIPFDLLRNREHRDAELGNYKFVLVSKGKAPMDPLEFARLVKAEQAGAAVILPKGFETPLGATLLAKAAEWDPEMVGEAIGSKKGISYAAGYTALQQHLQQGARHLREVLGKVGFKPYFDIPSVEVVSRPYEFQGHKMLFVVNDKRVPGKAMADEPPIAEPDANGVIPAIKAKPKKAVTGPPSATVGVPAEMEVIIRDTTPGLKVIDIDTGRELPLAPSAEGQKFTDTVPGAWYRIYAVVSPGQKYQGPPPLPAAPGIAQLAATRTPHGAELKWKTDVADWVGSDVQWYRIYRGEGSAAPMMVKELYGRSVEAGGGLIETFVDREVSGGKSYTYQVQAVSPLRIAGPLSSAAKLP